MVYSKGDPVDWNTINNLTAEELVGKYENVDADIQFRTMIEHQIAVIARSIGMGAKRASTPYHTINTVEKVDAILIAVNGTLEVEMELPDTRLINLPSTDDALANYRKGAPVEYCITAGFYNDGDSCITELRDWFNRNGINMIGQRTEFMVALSYPPNHAIEVQINKVMDHIGSEDTEEVRTAYNDITQTIIDNYLITCKDISECGVEPIVSEADVRRILWNNEIDLRPKDIRHIYGSTLK